MNEKSADPIEQPARESATAVLLREFDGELQALLLQKNAGLTYGGTWVFPGGVVDKQDHATAQEQFGNTERTNQALITVLRETQEETGLQLRPDQLHAFSNWLTPNFRIKRYNTLFFIAALDKRQASQKITVDGEEIVAASWISPTKALAAQAQGAMALNGPSFVILSQLLQFASTKPAVRRLSSGGISWYEPRATKTDTGVATVYHGDASYHFPELDAEILERHHQPAHRLYMHKAQPWDYVDSRKAPR